MINVIQLGLGPIGQRLTRYLLERKGIAIVGAVDPAPDKAGKDLGKLCCRKKMGVIISPGLAFTIKKTEADVAIISTVSSLEKVEEQIKEAADHSLNIISTCEELSYPWNTRPGWASRIDAYCKKHKVSCLGTGVNPGFLMDYLPAVLTSVCRKVEHIKVERVQDAQHRRLPFQKKIGVGLSEAEFRKKEAFLRHDGLPESVYMTAGALNWKLDKVEETRTPIIAGHDIQNGNSPVSKGRVAGLRQTAKGYRENKELISLVFQAAVGAGHPHDTIEITGEPGFRSTIPGGINGDVATSAIIVNAVRSVINMKPGLKTMLDIQVPTFFSFI